MSGSRYLQPIHSQAELREAIADVLADSQANPPRLWADNVPKVLYGLQIIASSLKADTPRRPPGRPRKERNDRQTT